MSTPDRLEMVQLVGEQADTHLEMQAAARALNDATMRAKEEIGPAQERFRKALAAHLAAIVGGPVSG